MQDSAPQSLEDLHVEPKVVFQPFGSIQSSTVLYYGSELDRRRHEPREQQVTVIDGSTAKTQILPQD